MYIFKFLRPAFPLFLICSIFSSASADLIDDPDGILGTLHIDGAQNNAFIDTPVFVSAGPEFEFQSPDFSVQVDFMGESLWITQIQTSANTLPWAIWLEDLEWGVPGGIIDILVPMQPPFMTTFTSNSIHITYLPAQQNPPGPGTTLTYHTDFLVQHIPEPSGIGLLLIGLCAMRLHRRIYAG